MANKYRVYAYVFLALGLVVAQALLPAVIAVFIGLLALARFFTEKNIPFLFISTDLWERRFWTNIRLLFPV